MTRQRDEVELDAVLPGTGVRTTVRGEAASAALRALVAATVASEAELDELDRPDSLVGRAAEHLAAVHGAALLRVAAVFEGIATRVYAGRLPTGNALLQSFGSGPLSWPRRVLALPSLGDPLALLEAEDLVSLPGRLDAADALADARTPLHSRHELAAVLADFAAHQERNAEALIRTGHPATAFAQSPWLDVRLNKLYPEKIPVVAEEVVADRRGAYDPRYVEGRRVAAPLSQQRAHRSASPPSPLVDEQVLDPFPIVRPTWGRWRRTGFSACGYDEADRMPELHDDDVEWIGSVRPKLQEVRVRVLAELTRALKAGKPDALMDKVIRVVAGRLDADEVKRLLRLDGKYQRHTALSDPGGVEPLPCMPGGFSALVELAGHVEKELTTGTLHRTREALGGLVVPDPLGRPRLHGSGQTEPYFQMVAGGDGPRWRSALTAFSESEAGEAAFWTGFRGRLADALAAAVPERVVVPVKPMYGDVIAPAVISQVRELTRELDDGVLSAGALLESAQGRRPVARFPHMDGIRWEEVTITFVSEQSVAITARGLSERYTFAELGFTDRRKGDLPDRVWMVFHELARHDGTLSWKDRKPDQAKRSNTATYIKRLRDRLQAVLSIEDDPFENYKTVGAYKTKFQLRSTAYDHRDGRTGDE